MNENLFFYVNSCILFKGNLGAVLKAIQFAASNKQTYGYLEDMFGITRSIAADKIVEDDTVCCATLCKIGGNEKIVYLIF